nr:HDOD domain-containing protein [candidate division Zixibacteria bacterium]
MKIRDRVISGISSFKTLPAMAERLLVLINNPDAEAAELTNVIQLDPALTANVLKAANSAFLGFQEPIDSIAEASFRIGTKWIYQLALSSLVYSNLRTPARGYDMTAEDFWKHSIAVAVMTDNLCKLLNIRDNGAIYTGGLVHDIGKLVMQESVEEFIDEIEELVDKNNISFEEAEEQVMGVDHTEAGAMLAEHWHFPERIMEIIRWHHQPDHTEHSNPGIDIVHVADVICLLEGFGLGRDGLKYRASEQAMVRLKLTSTVVEQATSLLLESIENVEHIFTGRTAASPIGR